MFPSFSVTSGVVFLSCLLTLLHFLSFSHSCRGSLSFFLFFVIDVMSSVPVDVAMDSAPHLVRIYTGGTDGWVYFDDRCFRLGR